MAGVACRKIGTLTDATNSAANSVDAANFRW